MWRSTHAGIVGEVTQHQITSALSENNARVARELALGFVGFENAVTVHNIIIHIKVTEADASSCKESVLDEGVLIETSGEDELSQFNPAIVGYWIAQDDIVGEEFHLVWSVASPKACGHHTVRIQNFLCFA